MLSVAVAAVILSIPLSVFTQEVDSTDLGRMIEDTRKKANISDLSVVIAEGGKLTYIGDRSCLYQIDL